MIKVQPISAAEFEGFVRRFNDPLLQDVAEYERWKAGLGILRTFWAGQERRLMFLGLEERGTPRRAEGAQGALLREETVGRRGQGTGGDPGHLSATP